MRNNIESTKNINQINERNNNEILSNDNNDELNSMRIIIKWLLSNININNYAIIMNQNNNEIKIGGV